MLMIILATISTNTAANIVSPTNVFQNVAPKYINENKGVILTGIIGIATDVLGAAEDGSAGWIQTSVWRAFIRTG